MRKLKVSIGLLNCILIAGMPIFSAEPASTQALTAFWTQFNRSSFPTGLPASIELMINSEDEVMQESSAIHAGVLKNINTHFNAYPVNFTSGDIWDTWLSKYDSSPFMGQPPAHSSLLMLKDIASNGQVAVSATSLPVVLTVLICNKAHGSRPTALDGSTTETVTLNINPAILANDYKVLRQSLRLFQRYIWGLTGGEAKLEIQFYQVDNAVDFSFSKPNNLSLDNYTQPMSSAPAEILKRTDMWWVIYPDNRPTNPKLASMGFVGGGGMGGFGEAPVFISEDSWPLNNRFGGEGAGGERIYTDVERRCYLPQWFQHEFYHHLYRIFPEFKLESIRDHQWFWKENWPSDFVGRREADYYSESYNKRLKTAQPRLAKRLRVAPHWSLDSAGSSVPTALAQSIIVQGNSSHGLTLKGNDAGGNPLTFVISQFPKNGALTGPAPNVIYTPTLNYTGKDSLTFFTLNSKGLESKKATVAITVSTSTATISYAKRTPLPVNKTKPFAFGKLFHGVDGDSLDYLDIFGRRFPRAGFINQ